MAAAGARIAPHDQVRAAVAVDVVHPRRRRVVQAFAVRVALRRRGALIAHPGRRFVGERRPAAVDEHLDVATREGNHVGQGIVVALVHEQQVLEPIAVDVEMRRRLGRRVAVVERRVRQFDAYRVVSGTVICQDDAELIDVRWIEVADLSQREVEVAVVVQVHEVVPYVPPELRTGVVKQLVGSAVLVERERAVLFVSLAAVGRPRKVHPLAPLVGSAGGGGGRTASRLAEQGP